MQDVIVIGGGPIGSRVAARLARLGHRVTVLEKRPGLGEPVGCTGIISRECRREFALPENLIIQPLRQARIFSPSGVQVALERPEPPAYLIDRAALDAWASTRAMENGAEYCLDTRVRGIQVNTRGVRVETVRGGATGVWEARVAVLAAGFNPTLSRRLGLEPPGDFAVGAQARVRTAGLTGVEIYVSRELAPDFFAWLVPISDQEALAGLLARRGAGRYLNRLLRMLEAQGKVIPGGVRVSFRGVSLRPPRRTCGERLLAVGDAAGQVKPTTGGGLYYGLLGADIAAATLHQALDQDNPSALAGYERAWRARLGDEIARGYRLRRLYEGLNTTQLERIFGIMRSAVVSKVLAEAGEAFFDWHSGALGQLIRQTGIPQALREAIPLSFLGEIFS